MYAPKVMNCNLCMSQFLQTVCETTHRSVSSVFFSILSDPTSDTPQTAPHDGLKGALQFGGEYSFRRLAINRTAKSPRRKNPASLIHGASTLSPETSSPGSIGSVQIFKMEIASAISLLLKKRFIPNLPAC